MQENANQVPIGAYPNALLRNAAGDLLVETGTLTRVGSPGRYKSFTTAFAAAPIVIASPVQGAPGTRFLLATPAAPGSFSARSSAGGSVRVNYVAIGNR